MRSLAKLCEKCARSCALPHETGRQIGAEAMIAKLNFYSPSVFSENLRKLKVKFDKPMYVGMCILGISKMCLHEFHHEYMTLLFYDTRKIMYTDSLSCRM